MEANWKQLDETIGNDDEDYHGESEPKTKYISPSNQELYHSAIIINAIIIYCMHFFKTVLQATCSHSPW